MEGFFISNSWISCICVVTFDLELGQIIENIYPENVCISESEKMNISYLSFPDSNSGCMGDLQYHFRIRVSNKTFENHETKGSQYFQSTQLNDNLPSYLKLQDGYIFGYVYFRQVPNKTIARGYFQKSVVIISRFPFVKLFHCVNRLLAPEFFQLTMDSGLNSAIIILESVFNDISHWPSPMNWFSDENGPPPLWLTLPILGNVLHCRLLTSNSSFGKHKPLDYNSYDDSNLVNILKGLKNGRSHCEDNDEKDWDFITHEDLVERREYMLSIKSSALDHVLPSVHEVNLFNAFRPLLKHIQHVWELVITCQPILVAGSDPRDTSLLVQALVQCIQPLAYSSDYRPYFTIYDSEFKEYTSKIQSPPNIILGITNPFFIKSLGQWPNIIRVDDLKLENSTETSQTAAKSLVTSSVSSNDVKRKQKKSKVFKDKSSFSSVLVSSHKFCLSPDKSLYKIVKEGVIKKRLKEVQSVIIRQYLLELTQSFVYPLERYVSSLMPFRKHISPLKKAPVMLRFQTDAFIESLSSAGPQLTSGTRGDWEALYRRFLTTPMFANWLSEKQIEINNKLRLFHFEILCKFDFEIWIKAEERREIELVDILIHIDEIVKSMRKSGYNLSPVDSAMINKHLNAILKHLPDDLTTSLQLNCLTESTPSQETSNRINFI